jgi:aminoglycoside phosphotransferase (APT) family kinase protein
MRGGLAAVETRPFDAEVWVHGDVVGTNMLVREGQLYAVIDFGCAAVGDPACDTTVAYTYFDGESRRIFTENLGVDGATWARGRGWALWKALIELATDLDRPGHATAAARRMGWRHQPAGVIGAVIDEHRRAERS